MKLLIIDNYDSFTYNLVQLVREAGKESWLLVKNDALNSVKAADFDKVLISPGPGLAHEAGDLMPFIQHYKSQKSFLGVCLGFEALVQSYGGVLSPLPFPLHGIQNQGKIVSEDAVFSGLPGRFAIGHYHSWYVKNEDLPVALEATLKDEQNMIMAFRHQIHDVRGLLFHPESYMTEFGSRMIANWLAE
ncbi:MAG: aminodeoxychorismate/anthranilate synthase component II [Bacteroidales bacterium]|nr:aminodeoxychorismate/anthranilate synthase component II [Bacteroidales bacterium]